MNQSLAVNGLRLVKALPSQGRELEIFEKMQLSAVGL